MSHDLILASRSPRRKMLLESLGLTLLQLPADIPEERNPGEKPTAYVARLAREKALAVESGGHTVLAADTIVVLDNEIMEKPQDEDHALSMWSKLSGEWHQVFTAYFLRRGSVERKATVETRVKFKDLSTPELHSYLKTDEWKDKAGGYAVQGISGYWVEAIDGSYTNVVGLPLTQVAVDLARLNPQWPSFPWS
ncbi:septum formation protein Maf [Myxococcota bacterium]|nr:septum formation protein Maf [Myxococcota bacterium]